MLNQFFNIGNHAHVVSPLHRHHIDRANIPVFSIGPITRTIVNPHYRYMLGLAYTQLICGRCLKINNICA